MAAVAAVFLASCSRSPQPTESQKTPAVLQEAVTTGPCTFSAPPTGGTITTVTFTVKTPQGVAPSEFALLSDLGSLRQESGVRLIKDAGGFASVGSMESTARLFIGANTEGQSAYAEQLGIDMGNNARLRGLVKTANTLTRGSNVVIDGTITQNTSLRPLATLSWTASFPSVNRGNCTLAANATQTIDPGTYGSLTIGSGARLKLRSGTYYFSSLSFSSGSFLDADNSAGPVFVNVRNGFTWNGSVTETQATLGNVVFALATSSATSLQTAIRGIVVAPNAALTISTGGTPGQVGSFFAKSIITTANTTFHHRPLSTAAVCTGGTNACNELCKCAAGGSCRAAADCQTGLLCTSSVCTVPNVDDGNPCTADSFVPGTGVVHTPVAAGTSCADANLCNGAETCNAAGTCTAGTAVVIDDANPCTTDACVTATGAVTHTPKASGTSCTDGNACNGAETCNASAVCVAGTPVVIDDGKPCTTDACNTSTGAVTHVNKPSGTSCADSNACNGSETCNSSGTCLAGTAPNLNDNNPCTTDACTPAGGITHAPVAVGTSCADSNACNGVETCNALGTCAPGTAVVVDDANPCTTDACNTSTGAVTHTPRASGSSCTDGNACNGNETCNASAVCVAGTPVVIDDGKPCTTDACNTSTGAVTHVNLPSGTSCADANLCNGAEACNSSGTCVAGTPVNVNDNNACTADACNTSTGAVTHNPVAAGTSCTDNNACNGAETCNASGTCQPGTPVVVDDGRPCTTDTCNTSTGAVTHTNKASGTSCTDGNACNGNETCNSSGTCLNGTPVNINDNNACTTDACNTSTGAVTHVAVAAGTPCPDNNQCNGTEICNASSACVAGPPPVLDDGNPCTADSCTTSQGIRHLPRPEGTSCTDGDACNGDESCDGSGTCQAGWPPALDDFNPCTTDSCDPATGTSFVPLPDGAHCSNGNACDGMETCADGYCSGPVIGVVLNDGDPCTVDECDPELGPSHTPVPVGGDCYLNGACNGRETCDAQGQCVSDGVPPVIDDDNPCTLDGCDTFVYHVPLGSGTSCSDGDPCNGTEACDGQGTCVASAAPQIDDGNPCTVDACDPETLGVTHTLLPAGSECAAATPCVGARACSATGVCQAGLRLEEDSNPCTTDSCDPVTGPVHVNLANGVSCSDGNACNGAETCASGTCTAGSAVTVDDSNACTTDLCDPATGAVTHPPLSAGTACADGNPCNGAERCNATGSCVAGPLPELTDDNDCTIDLCTAEGVVHQARPVGAPCSDGCDLGACDADARCVTTATATLDDGNRCTIDSCYGGVIHHDPAAGQSCNDGNPCNGDEVCTGGGACVSQNPPNLSDGNPCTIDSCDPVLGVVHTPAAAGTSCSDGDACNGSETCSAAGSCRGGVPLAVDDGNPCTLDRCAAGSGVITHEPLPAGMACSDNNGCNGLELCNAAGACQAGTPPVLDDGVACTVDSCDPVLGVLHTPNGQAGCTPRLDWVVDDNGSAPSPRDSFATAVSADGELALFGGHNAGAVTDDVWTFAFETSRWTRERTPVVRPSPRAGMAATADTGRNRLVVFGGVNKGMGGATLSELWEYDFASGAWAQPTGSTSGAPSPRSYAAAAYDSQRGRVLFVGGTDVSDSRETWAWNGTAWQLLASNGPSARYGAALAYDSVRDRFVLFGGTQSDASGATLGDTWLFNPGTNQWSAVTSPSAPSPRTAHALAFDPIAGKVVLFGGTNTGDLTLGDTWHFDVPSSTWSELQVVEAPAARAGHGLVYDPGARGVVVVGGLDYSADGRLTKQRVDLWLLDTSSVEPTWLERATEIAPARLVASAAYDTARGVMVTRTEDVVVYSDINTSSELATWEYSASEQSWSKIPTTTAPVPGALLVYDARRGRVIAVSSLRAASSTGPWNGVTIHEWNGTSWTLDCFINGQNDDPTSNGSVAFDSTSGKVLIYAGQGTQTARRDIRAIDPVACTSSYLSPAVFPPQRDFAASVFVPDEGRLYVFGGRSSTDRGSSYPTLRSDFWSYSMATNLWTQITGTGPVGRAFGRFVLDPVRRKLVLGPGRNSNDPKDTWEFDLTSRTWVQVATASPALTEPGAFVFDADLRRVVNVTQTGRRFVWNGAAWQNSEQTVTPGAREAPAAAWLPNLGQALFFGGVAGDGRRAFLDDTWLWNGAWRVLEGRITSPPSYSTQTAGLAARQPPARSGHALAAGWVVGQPSRDVPVIFGGENDGGLLNDTWSLDTTSQQWIRLLSGIGSPPPRAHHAMVYDGGTAYLMFGGLTATGPANDMWRLTPNSSVGSTSAAWQSINPSQRPSARYAHALALDTSRRKVLLFGGRSATTAFGDTWVYDPAVTSWTQISTPVAPRARFGHAMTYDSARQKILLTGGETSVVGQVLGDTWEWDFATNTWRAVPVSEHEPRAGHALWFQPSTASLVAFGGIVHRDAGTTAFTYGDTLTLSDLGRSAQPNWAPNGVQCTADTQCSSGFCVDGVCCNSRCTEQCGACNVFGVEGTCSPAAGPPRNGRPACPGDHSTCAPVCDGTDINACHFAPAATVCGSEPVGRCADSTHSYLTASQCDGAGTCLPPTLKSCAPYDCCQNCGVACRTQCFDEGMPCPGDPALTCVNQQCVFKERVTDIFGTPDPLLAGRPNSLSATANFSPAEFEIECRDFTGRVYPRCNYGFTSCTITPLVTGPALNCTASARYAGQTAPVAVGYETLQVIFQ